MKKEDLGLGSFEGFNYEAFQKDAIKQLKNGKPLSGKGCPDSTH